ncbi:molybdopterin binding oxidoreductase [Sanghuangporus baumii]|uniref:Molybdopterin binding oxidoreductase n=1 Tax=Sanghuangporus baumii TaxID=108892 RepID=A0A9Q5N4U0_SANBA|nr:molybdopterin binding oxidoreductase [Sanghuangporus baumii]
MGGQDMVFSHEVPHVDGLIVRAVQPFNAEPPPSALVEFKYTPEELIYCRNHSPVYELDEDTYTVTIDSVDGMLPKSIEIKYKDLKNDFPYAEVVAALQCAGNRRKEMGEIKPVRGVTWDCGVIANCCWGGVRLRDVLLRAGIDDSWSMEGLHVWFASHVSVCQDDSYYGGSIPLSKAIDPEGDVLLAFDMNSQSLSPDHGYPLRIVVPGYTGVRWVKWADRITIARDESPNFYQQRDYKILPPSCETVEQAAPLWRTVPAIDALPINSVIGSINEVPGEEGKIRLKGYAMGHGGPGRQIARVQVAIAPSDDSDEQWADANITYQEGKWSWTLWDCVLDLNEAKESIERIGGKNEVTVFCRAIDESEVVQKKECAWNMRGVAFNAYGKAIWRR